MPNGRPPKPAALKQLAGNPGNRPISPEPEPTKGAPNPPGDLTPEAFAEWCRIVPELEAIGLLAKVDRAYLVAYCEAWSNFCEAREAVREHGTLVQGRDGNLVKNPATQVMKDSLEMMLKYGTQFGLSPTARARMTFSIPQDKPDEGSALSLLSGGAG